MPELFHVYCSNAYPAIKYTLDDSGGKQLGLFQVSDAILKRICMAIDLPFTNSMIIEPPFQDTIRNRLANTIGKLSKDKEVAKACAQFIYTLGVARALNTPICWKKKED